MQKILLFVFLLFTVFSAYSTEYYSQSSGFANNPSNWNTARNGSGQSAAGFSSPNDVFIIQTGHSMNLNAAWNVSGNGSSIKIENNATLTATFAVTVDNFELLQGGNYIHNYAGVPPFLNNNTTFHTASNFEIKNWPGVQTPLPEAEWGNLVLDYSFGTADWVQNGNLHTVKGNLILRNTGNNRLVLTNSTTVTLNIGGNLLIENGGLQLSSGVNIATVNVGGNFLLNSTGELVLSGSSSHLDIIGFNVSGNVEANGTIIGSGFGSMITMNGTGKQLKASSAIGTGIRIAQGADISLAGNVEMSNGNIFIVAGKLSTGNFELNLNENYFVIPGGEFTSSGNVYAGITGICSGNGNTNMSSILAYCSMDGPAGKIILNDAIMNVNSGRFLIGEILGAQVSNGEMILSNFSEVNFSNNTLIEVTPNSYLEFDIESAFKGAASFSNNGYMVIGSSSGIRQTGNAGNIQVANRTFHNGPSTTYEYRSEESQSTGGGLPSELFGTVIFNHTGEDGIVLTNPLVIKEGGTLNLADGILHVSGFSTLTLEHNANFLGGGPGNFINGGLTKIGTANFTFHVGRDNLYSPVIINEVSGGLATDKYRVEYFPTKATNQFFGIIDQDEVTHISSMDTWLIEKLEGDLNSRKSVVVSYNERSGVNDLSSLIAVYKDGDFYRKQNNYSINGTTSSGTITFMPALYGPFTLGSTNAMMNPLPVNLVNFTAEKFGLTAALKWTITPDSNPDYFEIYHAGPDQQFTSIGRVNAYTGLQYNYNHYTPVQGDNYYQLRSTDKDGVVTYSKIEKLRFETAGNAAIALYPSVGQATNVIINQPSANDLKIVVRNQNGQFIKALNVQKNNSRVYIDMSNLPMGIYTISVFENHKLIDTRKFIRK